MGVDFTQKNPQTEHHFTQLNYYFINYLYLILYFLNVILKSQSGDFLTQTIIYY